MTLKAGRLANGAKNSTLGEQRLTAQTRGEHSCGVEQSRESRDTIPNKSERNATETRTNAKNLDAVFYLENGFFRFAIARNPERSPLGKRASFFNFERGFDDRI